MRLPDAERNARAEEGAGKASAWAAVIAFPAMNVALRTDAERLTAIVYLPLTVPQRPPECALAERAVRQIERYREDPDARFDLPLAPAGSAFQRAVWAQISAIARGSTRTYGDLARELGAPARAVGQACGDNPYPVVVPCHRVVAAGGLGGFAHHRDGFLIDAKKWLLQHECPALEQQPGSLWHAAN